MWHEKTYRDKGDSNGLTRESSNDWNRNQELKYSKYLKSYMKIRLVQPTACRTAERETKQGTEEGYRHRIDLNPKISENKTQTAVDHDILCLSTLPPDSGTLISK
ncbi:hypothetical protein AMECASPLE_009582 [Ameca splendens]|uniref:Uncharacterized protein n=1 Tax=Ameca splendens TaxID=208324 RepID=A0ABV0YZN1_9TELE